MQIECRPRADIFECTGAIRNIHYSGQPQTGEKQTLTMTGTMWEIKHHKFLRDGFDEAVSRAQTCQMLKYSPRRTANPCRQSIPNLVGYMQVQWMVAACSADASCRVTRFPRHPLGRCTFARYTPFRTWKRAFCHVRRREEKNRPNVGSQRWEGDRYGRPGTYFIMISAQRYLGNIRRFPRLQGPGYQRF